MKALTVKDVLYATQFGGQKLKAIPGGHKGVEFKLIPSGLRVPNSIADQARAAQAKESSHAET